MKIALALLLAGSVSAAAWTQSTDPLKSEACAAALASLQSARGAGNGSVEGARAAAATACLGSAVQPVRPPRTVRAPIVVPPPQVEVAEPAALRIPPPQLPAPAVVIERAPMPAQCDAAGCWVPGSGTHLRHVPPHLAGPGALCMLQGGATYCP